MATNDSPLLTALPPATDYISYLTIVEQYLTEENLPILHRVLENETLTINIGWDLVQLLLPLLPASEECLQIIARLGNPREVILKVTEALRLIEYDDDGEDAIAGASRSDKVEHDERQTEKMPLAVEQYITLVSMLITLHSRIKTKYPSRFLSTTLQAMLASFSNSISWRDEMVVSIVQTVKQIRGIRRPPLPSRSSSASLSRTVSTSSEQHPDPEASAKSGTSTEEAELQTKLFQSFVTHVLEEYLTTLTDADGLSYMAWSTRLTEQLQPERLLPVAKDKSATARFSQNDVLCNRVDTVGQLASLSQDLAISDADLLRAITAPQHERSPTDGEEEDPPPTAADVALSSHGSLLLYATKQISTALYGRSTQSISSFHIFPEHEMIVRAVLSGDAVSTSGSSSLAIVDACLALGLLALANNQIGEPESNASFDDYLRIIAVVASSCSDASLRGHAHYLATTVLRSHPEQSERLAFVRDVFENTPMDNLKPIAVGWLKGEIIEAVLASPSLSRSDKQATVIRSELDNFADLVFPSLSTKLVDADLQEAWTEFQVNISFYLASINFLYYMLYAQEESEALEVSDFIQQHRVDSRFIEPLEQARQRLQEAVNSNQHGIVDATDTDSVEAYKAELNVLAQTLERLQSVRKAGK